MVTKKLLKTVSLFSQVTTTECFIRKIFMKTLPVSFNEFIDTTNYCEFVDWEFEEETKKRSRY